MTALIKVQSLGLGGHIIFIGLLTVLTVSVQTTQAQSYLLTLSQNQLLNPSNQQKDNNIYKLPVETDDSEENTYIRTDEDNSTVIVIKNIKTQETSELSQSAMDVITIIWYVATFLALAAFFLLMACSDRRCGNNRQNGSNNNNDTPLPPPTPSPSYSEFAPPSYDTVMKTQHAAKATIFVIPLSIDSPKESNSNSSSNNNNISDISNNNNNNNSDSSNINIVDSQPNTPTTPIVNFYTINELQKFGS